MATAPQKTRYEKRMAKMAKIEGLHKHRVEEAENKQTVRSRVWTLAEGVR